MHANTCSVVGWQAWGWGAGGAKAGRCLFFPCLLCFHGVARCLGPGWRRMLFRGDPWAPRPFSPPRVWVGSSSQCVTRACTHGGRYHHTHLYCTVYTASEYLTCSFQRKSTLSLFRSLAGVSSINRSTGNQNTKVSHVWLCVRTLCWQLPNKHTSYM